MNLNKVMLIGRLGKDPEMRHAGTVPVVSFPLATSETYKDKSGNKQENTEWHNIVIWRNLAETAERFLKKGKLVYIEGRLKTRNWEDKDGNKRYTTEIVADNFIILEKREDSEYGGQGGSREQYAPRESYASQEAGPASPATPESIPEDDDLPF
jgi:single-strand DNA-binding protein